MSVQAKEVVPSKFILTRDLYALLVLSMMVICAMTSSTITATKPIHFVLMYPFSNIIFALFTFPIIDAVCELYGKRKAYFISILGVVSQVVFVIIIELSVVTPHAVQWHDQSMCSVFDHIDGITYS